MIEVSNLTKLYGSIPALKDISLELDGKIAILGENGAGKTTLLKILYGIVSPSSGKITINGKTYLSLNPKLARELGIRYIPQFPPVVDSFYVWEFLKMIGIDKREFKEKMEDLGFYIPLDIRMKYLDLNQRRLLYLTIVTIDRGNYYLLDEITSGLSGDLQNKILGIINNIEGTTILVTHNVDEAIKFANKIIVMRKGKISGIFKRGEFDKEKILKVMFNREPPEIKYIEANVGNTVLKHREIIVRQGEVVGIFGIAGNGQLELYLDIVKKIGASHSSSIFRYSISPNMSLLENYLIQKVEELPHIFSNSFLKKAREDTRKIIEMYNVNCKSIDQRISELSGGNIMKFIMGRALENGGKNRPIILYNPTSGLDEYSRKEILIKIQEKKLRGYGILMFSEDIRDSVICDRGYVISKGKIIASLEKKDLTQKKLEEILIQN